MKKVLDLQRSLLLLTNCNGNTALHIAARLGHLDMTELLITTCAKEQEAAEKFLLLRKRNLEENTALHEAIRNNYYDIVKLLIWEDPELVSFTNNAGEYPLFLAVDQGFFKIAHYIIDTVPKCFYGGRNNMNVSHAAVIRYQTNFLRKIFDKFPKAILESDKNGWTPLHYAAYFGNTEVVKMFLENNISLAYKIDKEGISALHISAMRGSGGVMRALIIKCPNTCELLDNKGRTALHLAVEHGKKNAVKLLLQTLTFQDHINEQDKEGNTPLHVAAINDRFKISLMLTDDRRVEKLAVNKEGMSAADIIESRRKLSWSENKAFLSNWLSGERQLTNSLERVVGSHIQATKREPVVSKMGEDNNTEDPETDLDIRSMSNFQITAITIITTITFAAGLQLPGGFDTNGKAVLRDNDDFKEFLEYVSAAFVTSASAMFIHFCMALFPKYHSIEYATVLLLSILIEMSILFMVFAFGSGISAVLDENSTISESASNSFHIPVVPFLYFLISRMGFPYIPRARKLLGYM
ncbi:ankyrin repeat-containing protein At5g02620-like [Quercus robur]|uniref:ankyrin repeat-containing protein At5g02620-like n=1 Tax=Quercus robur TaxID=38942 RepID=UPI002163C5EB|nr:ankyrin repeat-containing protein At5g02620-like [Quercus robur]